jgi:hypothetical protein
MPTQGLQPNLCFQPLVSSAAPVPAVYAVPSLIVSSMTGVRRLPPDCYGWDLLRRSSSSTSLHPVPLRASWPSIHASPSITHILLAADKKEQSSGELCTLSTWMGQHGYPLSRIRCEASTRQRPEARRMSLARRTLVEDQRCNRSVRRMSHREHRKSPAVPSCNPEVAKEISSR